MNAGLKPFTLVDIVTGSEKERAQAIVESYGRTSMAAFALLDDKTYFFSQGGSLIAYAVLGGVAVVMGDPIGPPQDVRDAIAEFQAYCRLRGWLPAFCLTASDYLDDYCQVGFGHLGLGAEAIIDLDAFTLRGRANSSFRKRFKRMQRQGYQFRLLEPPISDDYLDQLRQTSRDWLGRMYGPEKGFFLGWFEDDYIRSCRVAVVLTPEGQVSAFANLVSEYQLNEISMDLVRYRRKAASGTIDFLAVSLFKWAKDSGYDSFNLGLCALAEVGCRSDSSLLERAIHFIYKNGNWFYGFKGLHQYKKKFHPRWEPQFLVYPGWKAFIPVCIAVARLSLGQAKRVHVQEQAELNPEQA